MRNRRNERCGYGLDFCHERKGAMRSSTCAGKIHRMPSADWPPGGTIGWMNFEWVRTGVEPNRPKASVPQAAARFIGPDDGPTKKSAKRNSAAASVRPRSQALTAAAPVLAETKDCAREKLRRTADQKHRAVDAAAQQLRQIPPNVGPASPYRDARRRCRVQSTAGRKTCICRRRPRAFPQTAANPARLTAAAPALPPSGRVTNRSDGRGNGCGRCRDW